jgi:hypothetical protein
MSGKVRFKFLLAVKILTYNGYFTGSRIRILPSPNGNGGNSKGIVSLNSAFENADSQSSTCYEKLYRTRFISGLGNSLNKQVEEGYWKDFYN